MDKIKSDIIIEMLGRPKEHLRKTMKDFLKKIGAERGVVVAGKKIHSPRKVEQKDNEGKIIKIPGNREVFTTFAEVSLETETIFDLIRIIFIYMPSHIEILEPGEFMMQNIDIAAVLNEITKKLHQYDAIAKNALMQNQMLANKILQMRQLLRGGQQSGAGLQKELEVSELKSPERKKKKGKRQGKWMKRKKL